MQIKELRNNINGEKAAKYWDALLDVVEAASDEPLSWNEELCNSKEEEQRTLAWEKLRKALKKLEEL